MQACSWRFFFFFCYFYKYLLFTSKVSFDKQSEVLPNNNMFFFFFFLSFTLKVLGCFNPTLGQIWTNPNVGLKNVIKKFNPMAGFVHI